MTGQSPKCHVPPSPMVKSLLKALCQRDDTDMPHAGLIVRVDISMEMVPMASVHQTVQLQRTQSLLRTGSNLLQMMPLCSRRIITKHHNEFSTNEIFFIRVKIQYVWKTPKINIWNIWNMFLKLLLLSINSPINLRTPSILHLHHLTLIDPGFRL